MLSDTIHPTVMLFDKKNTNCAGPDLMCVVWLVVSGLVAPLSVVVFADTATCAGQSSPRRYGILVTIPNQ